MKTRDLFLIVGLLLIGVNGFAADGDLIVLNGRIGIGTTGPRRLLDVLGSSGDPQLRLTYTDNSVYTDFRTTDNGKLYITPIGNEMYLFGSSVSNPWLRAESSVATLIANGASDTTYTYGGQIQLRKSRGTLMYPTRPMTQLELLRHTEDARRV